MIGIGANKMLIGKSDSDIEGDSGKYQVTYSYGLKPYLSSDYGETWSELSNCTAATSSIRLGAFISSDGTIIMLYDNTKLYYSINSGVSWTTKTFSSSIYGMAVSDDCQYVYVSEFGTFNRSSDYGSTWNSHSDDSLGVGCSPDGSIVMYWTVANNYLKKSTNYGSSFSNFLYTNYNIYVIALSSLSESIIYEGYHKIYRSSDSGISWTDANNNVWTDSGRYHYVYIDTTGQYMTVNFEETTDGLNYTPGAFISSDYGVSFSRISGTNHSKMAISKGGRYVSIIQNNNKVLLSDDYGGTWKSVTHYSHNSTRGNSIAINR